MKVAYRWFKANMKDADCIYKANGRAASCIHEAKVGVAEFDFTISIGRDTILEGCTQQIHDPR